MQSRSMEWIFSLILLVCLHEVNCEPAHESIIKGGRAYRITYFFDSSGKAILNDTVKIWYSDSTAIEEIHRINIVTDTSNKTTVSFTVMFYRFMDLKRKAWAGLSNVFRYGLPSEAR